MTLGTANPANTNSMAIMASFDAEVMIPQHSQPVLGGEEIKARIRDALYPDEDAWKELIFARAVEVFRKAIS